MRQGRFKACGLVPRTQQLAIAIIEDPRARRAPPGDRGAIAEGLLITLQRALLQEEEDREAGEAGLRLVRRMLGLQMRAACSILT